MFADRLTLTNIADRKVIILFIYRSYEYKTPFIAKSFQKFMIKVEINLNRFATFAAEKWQSG